MLNPNDFTKPNIYCFDMNQYDPTSQYLICTIFVNYAGELWVQDIKALARCYFIWYGDRWILCKKVSEVLQSGLAGIVKRIRELEDGNDDTGKDDLYN